MCISVTDKDKNDPADQNDSEYGDSESDYDDGQNSFDDWKYWLFSLTKSIVIINWEPGNLYYFS